MKKIMMTMAVAAMSMTAMMAQSHEVTTTDKNGNKVVYEISDAAGTKGDTLSITTFDPNSVAKSDSINGIDKDEEYRLTREDVRMVLDELNLDSDWSSWVRAGMAGMVFAALFGIFLPLAIIIAVLLYRFYNRKKKYELAQKIVESGQPLPENFAKMVGEEIKEDKGGLFERGVKNVGIGIALSLMLWFMTGEVWMGCIGLFVVANGVSQLLTYYKYKPMNNKEINPENSTNTDNTL